MVGILGICIVVAAVLLLPALAQRPIPAYIHDWNWPPDRISLLALLSRGWSAWDPSGLGQPNAYISALPQFPVLWLLAKIVSPMAVLWIFLFTIWVGGLLGTAWLARRALNLPWQWAILAGIFYMASPVAFTKFIAGHRSFLEAYALLPWFIGCALRANRGDDRRFLWAAAFVAITMSVQLQFIGITLYVLLLMVLTRSLSWKRALFIVAFALPGILPQLIGPTLLQARAGSLSMQQAVVSWEKTQSILPLLALEGRGYFTGYFEQLTPLRAQGVLLLFPFLAVAGLALPATRGLRIFLLVLAATGWVLVAGANGPLGPFLQYAFEHVTAASLYRELFDLMPLLWLPYALLACVTLATLPRAFGVPIALLLAAVLLPSWITAPTLLGNASWAADVTAARALSPPGVSGYVVWWPSDQPIGPPNSRGGSDPLEFAPAGELTPLYEYEPHDEFAAAIDLANEGKWSAAAALFRSLGVAMLVDRTGLISFRHPELSARVRPGDGLRKHGATPSYVVYWVEPALGYVSLQASRANSVLPGDSLAHSTVESQPNERNLVAAFPFYDVGSVVAQCGSDSVLGYPAAFVRTGYPWFLAARARGSTGCEWVSRAALQKLPSDVLVVASRWAQYKPAGRAATQTAAAALGSVVLRSRTPDEVVGTYQIGSDATLVMRTSFDSRWLLDTGGTPRFSSRTDRYANGWKVSPGVRRFRIYFAPAAGITLLLFACALWTLALAMFFVIGSRPPREVVPARSSFLLN